MKLNKNDLFIYLLLSLSMLVFVPGRFAYGLILILEYNFILLLGILFSNLIYILHLEDLKNICFAIGIIFFAVLYKLLIRLYSPMIAFNLGILFYMPPLSVFVLGNIYSKNQEVSLASQLKSTMFKSLYFTIFAFIFYILRDLFGYGTISLPSIHGVYELFVIKEMKYSFIGIFFASIPGALFLVSLFYILVSYFLNSASIFKNKAGE